MKDIVIEDFENLIYADSSETKCLREDYNFPINKAHSSAFVDINGDCINDILFHSSDASRQFLEIWIGKKSADGKIKYCLSEKKPIPYNFGLFAIADINNDGQLDLVFPIKNSVPPAIYVAYNQKAFDYDWTKNYCESIQEANAKNIKEKEILFDPFNANIITNVK